MGKYSDKDVFKLLDPATKKLILEIKNPKVPIKPMEESCEGINLAIALEQFNLIPDFGFHETPLEFQTMKRGWQLFAEIIKPR